MKPVNPLPGAETLQEYQVLALPINVHLISINKKTGKARSFRTTGTRTVGYQPVLRRWFTNTPKTYTVHAGYWFFDNNWVFYDTPETRTHLLLRRINLGLIQEKL